MENGEAEGNTHLHNGNVSEHVVACGQRVVEEVVVYFGACGLEICHIFIKGVGVACADCFGEPCVEAGKWNEYAQAPQSAEEVEEEMAHRGTFCGHVAAERCKNRGNGGTDVRAEDKRACEVECNPAFGAHNQRNGECRSRRLDDHSDNEAHKGEDEYGAQAHCRVVFKHGEHFGIVLKVGHVCANHIEAHE